MKNIFKIFVFSALIIGQSCLKAEEKYNNDVPAFFKNNPFDDESNKVRLRGVKIISVDDENYPDHLRKKQKK